MSRSETDERGSGPAPATRRTALLVLGMHRGGTSAVTRVLNLLGADLGERLVEPHPDNPRGYWEHAEITALHHQMLLGLGRGWDDPTPMPPGWLDRPGVVDAGERLLKILNRDFGSSSLLCLKDPRLCRIVPLWRELLPRFACAPRFVIAIRNPTECARSLAVRDGCKHARAHVLWLRHMLEAEAATRGFPRVFVSYDRLLSDWKAESQRMGRDLSLSWPVSLSTAAARIDAFLEEGLRHHRVGKEELDGDDAVPVRVRDAYRALASAARGDTDNLEQTLDTVGAEVTTADRLLSGLLTELRDKLKKDQVELLDLEGRHAELGEELRRTRVELEITSARQRELQEELNGRDEATPSELEEAGESGQTETRVKNDSPPMDGPDEAAKEASPRLDSAFSRVGSHAGRVYRLLRRWFGVTVRRLIPRPLREVISTSEGFLACGPRPSLLLCDQRSEAPRRWTLLRWRARAQRGTLCPKLYVDGGTGFVAEPAFAFPTAPTERVSVLIRLPDRVDRLRVDPMQSPGPFCLDRVLAVELGLFHVALLLARDLLLAAVREKGSIVATVTSGIGFLIRHGREGLKTWLRANYQFHGEQVGGMALAAEQRAQTPPVDPIAAWHGVNQWTDRRREHLEARLRETASLPRFSLLVPAPTPECQALELTMRSVLDQVYGDLEMIVATGQSLRSSAPDFLDQCASRDSRVRLIRTDPWAGTPQAVNQAATHATGSFVAALEPGDELAPDALGEVALYVAAHPETDYLYTDEVVGSGEGDDSLEEPTFKPDFSPELLLSIHYTARLSVIRCALFEELGGMRTALDGAHEHDLALRATERARHVGHLPLVLCRRNTGEARASSQFHAKQSVMAGRRAVSEALARRERPGDVFWPAWAEVSGALRFGHDFADTGPTVAVVIPTHNQSELLRSCLDSLGKTTYQNLEVVVVDDRSSCEETLTYLESLSHRVLRIASPGGRFNFAYLLNRAVDRVVSEYVLFLNNDIEVLEPRWLSRMMGLARLPGVGVVGARLLYPDGRLQHGGVVHGSCGGLPAHVCSGAPGDERGRLDQLELTCNCAAVTGACMLTPRRLFLELGGLDEERFRAAFNDVDYCFRVRDRGLRCVYTGGAELLHHEAATRGVEVDPLEEAAFRERYRSLRDPYYSPHLSLTEPRFSIRPRAFCLAGPPRPIRTLVFCRHLVADDAAQLQLELIAGLKKVGAIAPLVALQEAGATPEQYRQADISIASLPPSLGHLRTTADYERSVARVARYVESTDAELLWVHGLSS
ncbi:glycosyltransferase, partial [Planctomycetota bacterium]